MFAANSSQKADDKLYVDDVFSTYLYTGNGSTQTINNGIDLAGKGGLVWVKNRNSTAGSILENHALADSARGVVSRLFANTTDSQATGGFIDAFNSNGFTLSANGFGTQNSNSYVSWTFRKAPKFFDVVTYIGDGTNSTKPHALGVKPGLIIYKRTDTAANWLVWVDTLGPYYDLVLNTTYVQNGSDKFNGTNTSESVFGVQVGYTNASGATYVAYLFAHDPSPDGIIQCGSFTADASGNATVNTIGWEPQFAMIKASSTTGDWIMLDSMRGWNLTATDAKLAANLVDAESLSEYGNPTATGFDFKGGAANATYVYMVIRRPNKPPTSGSEVFRSTLEQAVGTPVNDINRYYDLILSKQKNAVSDWLLKDRLRGLGSISPVIASPSLTTNSTSAEADSKFFGTYNGVGWGDLSGSPVDYLFKRAPGFFDVVAYTGTGSGVTAGHNLGTVPEMIIIADRDGGSRWGVGHRQGGLTTWSGAYLGAFNSSAAVDYNSQIVQATTTTFTTSQAPDTTSGHRYIAYLFASFPGISKVGGYIGNGTSQTINCGFTTGARFVLCKRTNSAGDWYVWDTARGIVADNDPHLSLNTTAAEVATDDSVDPASTGFIVNQNTATNINVSGGEYLYLAIA